MQLRLSLLGLFLFATFWSLLPAQSLLEHVNPIIGTKGYPVYGRTTPFVGPPFAMTHWTPMTVYPMIGLPNYVYERRLMIGFRGSHKPAMWMGDYGHVTIMPGTGRWKISSVLRGMRFRHSSERSKPNLYSVDLRPERAKEVKVDMTATTRCGFFRIQIPEKGGWIMVEASKQDEFEGFIEIDTLKNEIRGYNPDRKPVKIQPDLKGFKGYFVLKFDQPFQEFGTYSGKKKSKGISSVKGSRVGAFVNFSGGTVKVKVGTSFIDLAQAEDNLNREIADWDFQKIADQTGDTWESYLNRIQIEGATEDEAAIFYTGMYRCLTFPRTFSEYGRYYSAYDHKVHEGESYTDFSLWDTFRDEHPLLTLIAPEKVDGFVKALLQMYQEGGYMPKWPNPGYSNIMIGTHADAVVADAYVKGFRGFDKDLAWEAMYKNAMSPPEGDSLKRWADRDPWTSYEARGGLYWYKKLGYVPADKTAESVSRTVEFSYGDFCLAMMAKALGKEKEYNYFMERSRNYQNLYNPETDFLAPRNADGTWHDRPKEGFTEGGKWTYLFGAMHDPEGMVKMLGGDEKFIRKLDENFEKGHYVHENEPGHHYSWLYNWTSQPEKTQERTAYYRAHKYRNHPNGLNGDEDCGQMSAWYIFSALGLYDIAPGSGKYTLGSPLFEKSVIKLQGGKELSILAKNVGNERIYVKSVIWNGEKIEGWMISHEELAKGGVLEFEMVGPQIK